MAHLLADRVRETTTVEGTGAATLGGAVTGYRAFGAALANADTCYYSIVAQDGSGWENGLGTYASAGNALTRTTVLSSSNAGAPVDFAAGTKDIFITQPARPSLTALAALTPAADRLPYFNGAAGAALATFTSFARTLLDDADAATARATLGAHGAAVVTTLGGDVTTSSNVLGNAVAIPNSPAIGNIVEIEIFGIYRTAATTTGIGLAIAGSAGTYMGITRIRQAAAGTDSTFEDMVLASGVAVTSTGVVAANTDYGFYMKFLVTAAAVGAMQLQIASEVNTSPVTLRAGTRIVARKVG